MNPYLFSLCGIYLEQATYLKYIYIVALKATVGKSEVSYLLGQGPAYHRDLRLKTKKIT